MNYQNIWKGCEHIRINSDNTTTIAYINNMRRIVPDSCNNLFYYCLNRNVQLSVILAPGKNNKT